MFRMSLAFALCVFGSLVLQKYMVIQFPTHGHDYLMIQFTSFMLFNLITPYIINKVGSKWCMTFAGGLYLLYTWGMVHFPEVYRWPIILGSGFMASLIWNASGVYKNEISTDQNRAKFAGVFLTFYKGSIVIGLLAVAFVGDTLVHALEVYTLIGLFGFILFFFIPNPRVVKEAGFESKPSINPYAIAIGSLVFVMNMFMALAMTKITVLISQTNPKYVGVFASLIFLYPMFLAGALGAWVDKAVEKRLLSCLKISIGLGVVSTVPLMIFEPSLLVLFLSISGCSIILAFLDIPSHTMSGHYTPVTHLASITSTMYMLRNLGLVFGVFLSKMLSVPLQALVLLIFITVICLGVIKMFKGKTQEEIKSTYVR